MNNVEAAEIIAEMVDDVETDFCRIFIKYEKKPEAWIAAVDGYLNFMKKYSIDKDVSEYINVTIEKLFTDEYFSKWRNPKNIKRIVSSVKAKIYKYTAGGY